MDQYTLFYLLGIYIAFAVGAWSVIISHFGRKKDPFSNLAVMRIPYIVAFIFFLIGGLFSWNDVLQLVFNHSGLLLVAAFGSTTAAVLRMYASKHMPVGVLATIIAVTFILAVFIYELLFMHTLPNVAQGLIISLITLGTVALIFIKNHTSLSFNKMSFAGILTSAGARTANGLAYVMMGDVARDANPYATAILFRLRTH